MKPGHVEVIKDCKGCKRRFTAEVPLGDRAPDHCSKCSGGKK